MGFRSVADTKAKCPLYEQVVKSDNNKIAGIQCQFFFINLGFSASMVVRLKGWEEVKDYKEIFCDDMFQGCPYFQAWQRAQNIKQK